MTGPLIGLTIGIPAGLPEQTRNVLGMRRWLNDAPVLVRPAGVVRAETAVSYEPDENVPDSEDEPDEEIEEAASAEVVLPTDPEPVPAMAGRAPSTKRRRVPLP